MNSILINTSGVESFFQLLGVLLIFIFVLAATYFTTRWVAGFQKSQLNNKNLQVIETLKITTNKYIQIVKVADQYLVIAIGKDEINLLTILDSDSIDEEIVQNADLPINMESFQDILEKVKKRIPQRQGKDEDKEI